eukprot:752433-Hanusia_phi.AAC.2
MNLEVVKVSFSFALLTPKLTHPPLPLRSPHILSFHPSFIPSIDLLAPQMLSRSISRGSCLILVIHVHDSISIILEILQNR